MAVRRAGSSIMQLWWPKPSSGKQRTVYRRVLALLPLIPNRLTVSQSMSPVYPTRSVGPLLEPHSQVRSNN